jgi:hypothetical protein
MRATFILAVTGLACSREFSVPAEPGAPEVLGLAVSPAIAREGDELEIAFSLSHLGAADPIVTLGGVSARKRAGPGTDLGYLYSYTVAGTEPEGQDVTVRVEASGRTSTSSAVATVRFDFTPPALSGAIASSRALAGAGEEVVLIVTPSEALSALALSLGGRSAACAASSPAPAWSCAYTPGGDEREGPQHAALTLADTVGNAAVAEAAAGVSFDFHTGAPPAVLALSVRPAQARIGSTLSITFATDRELALPPLVTVAGEPAARESGPDAERAWAYRFSVTGEEAEGEQPVRVAVEDLLGRAGETTAAVRLDYSVPRIVSAQATPAAVRAGATVTLALTASEALRRVEAAAFGSVATCAAGDDAALWRCPFTPSGTEAQGPADVTLSLTDLAGNSGPATVENAFVLDFACAVDASRLVVRRGTGLDARFEAAAGAFEKGAAVALEDAAGEPLAQAVAGEDGQVTPVVAGGGDRAEVFARATDLAGNVCTPQRVRSLYTATFAGKVAGAAAPNASTLRLLVVVDPAPAVAALEAAPDPAQTEYDAATGADAQAANAAAAALTTPPRWVPTIPLATSGHGLAYDSARKRLVLFGGNTGPTGLIDETFEHDGQRWIRREHAVGPPRNFYTPLVFDAARAKAVTFNGAETWEWDGTSWSKKNPATSPPERSGHALAYDPVSGQTVLWGGSPKFGAPFDPDTWTWDGANWTRHQVAAPGPRLNHAMARDPRPEGGVLLFGGADLVSSVFTKFQDTWRWDGAAWTRIATTGPPVRSSTAMAADPVARTVVLFGGSGPAFNSYLDDVWIWNGVSWAPPEELDTNVTARSAHAMAYDTERGRVVMYGGVTGPSTQWLSDFVEWNGTNGWDAPPTLDPPRDTAIAAAYDAARARTVVVAGAGAGTGNTWLWDGAAWERPATPAAPGARSGHAMVYDPRRRRTVLFGGVSGTAHYNDAWDWDGAAWTRPDPADKPSGRARHGMVFDAKLGKAVVFGGWNGLADLNDTWTWDGVSWVRLRPATKPARRQSPAFAYDAFRARGLLFGGMAGTAWQGDTWSWNGAEWFDADPDFFPPAAANPATVYDSARRRVLLIGSQVWEFDGESWSTLAGIQQGPGPFQNATRSQFALAYDSARRRVVLAGGTPAGPPWELEIPYAYPVAFARFDLAAVSLRPAAALEVRAVAAGAGAGDTGASRPGVGLFLHDAQQGWIDAGSNAALESADTAARTISFRAEGEAAARLFSSGVLRALLVPAHGASHRGGASVKLDAIELVLEE